MFYSKLTAWMNIQLKRLYMMLTLLVQDNTTLIKYGLMKLKCSASLKDLAKRIMWRQKSKQNYLNKNHTAMTPQEKAKELFDKFCFIMPDINDDGSAAVEAAKQC